MLQWSFYLRDTHLPEEGIPIKPATYVRGKTQRHKDLGGLLCCFSVPRIFLRKANLSLCLRILHHARHLHRFRNSMWKFCESGKIANRRIHLFLWGNFDNFELLTYRFAQLRPLDLDLFEAQYRNQTRRMTRTENFDEILIHVIWS